MKQLAVIDFGTLKGIGPLGTNQGATSITTFSNFISSAIGLMTLVAIIWFVFTLITGAIGIISSGGDKSALENSRKKITSGLIGLIIVFTALILINLIGYLLGIPDILNIQSMFTTVIKSLSP